MKTRLHLFILTAVSALLLTLSLIELLSQPGLAAPNPQPAEPITIKKESSASAAESSGRQKSGSTQLSGIWSQS